MAILIFTNLWVGYLDGWKSNKFCVRNDFVTAIESGWSEYYSFSFFFFLMNIRIVITLQTFSNKIRIFRIFHNNIVIKFDT